MSTIEMFYYVGLFCLASCIEDVVNIKRLKKGNKVTNDVLDNLDSVNALKSKIGTGIDISDELSIVKESYKKNAKEIKPLRVIVVFITLLWNVIGIFISEQKLFFIVLLLITFLSPYLIRMITKDVRQQLILSYITNIVSFLFVLLICYNHFFKAIN